MSLCSKGLPAYCIVMSGGYRDDIDEGLEIDYTGEGGQTNGKHVSLLYAIPTCDIANINMPGYDVILCMYMMTLHKL